MHFIALGSNFVFHYFCFACIQHQAGVADKLNKVGQVESKVEREKSNSASALLVAPISVVSMDETPVLMEDMKMFFTKVVTTPRLRMEQCARTGRMPVFWWTYLYLIR